MSIIEIEVADKRNRDLWFPPLRQRVRGRLDFYRVPDKKVFASFVQDFGTLPIPGEILGVNVETGECYRREPLREPQYAALRTKLEKGFKIADERQPCAGGYPDEWLYWMKRAVEDGTAELVAGEFPAYLDYIPPENPFKPKPKSMKEQIEKRLREDLDFRVRWAGMSDKQRKDVLTAAFEVPSV